MAKNKPRWIPKPKTFIEQNYLERWNAIKEKRRKKQEEVFKILTKKLK